MLSKTIQKSAEDIAQDINRPRYFDAWEAKDYGIIDQVCQSFRFDISPLIRRKVLNG